MDPLSEGTVPLEWAPHIHFKQDTEVVPVTMPQIPLGTDTASIMGVSQFGQQNNNNNHTPLSVVCNPVGSSDSMQINTTFDDSPINVGHAPLNTQSEYTTTVPRPLLNVPQNSADVQLPAVNTSSIPIDMSFDNSAHSDVPLGVPPQLDPLNPFDNEPVHIEVDMSSLGDVSFSDLLANEFAIRQQLTIGAEEKVAEVKVLAQQAHDKVVENIKLQHEAELRQIREFAEKEHSKQLSMVELSSEKRVCRQFEETQRVVADSHIREIENLRTLAAQQCADVKRQHEVDLVRLQEQYETRQSQEVERVRENASQEHARSIEDTTVSIRLQHERQIEELQLCAQREFQEHKRAYEERIEAQLQAVSATHELEINELRLNSEREKEVTIGLFKSEAEQRHQEAMEAVRAKARDDIQLRQLQSEKSHAGALEEARRAAEAQLTREVQIIRTEAEQLHALKLSELTRRYENDCLETARSRRDTDVEYVSTVNGQGSCGSDGGFFSPLSVTSASAACDHTPLPRRCSEVTLSSRSNVPQFPKRISLDLSRKSVGTTPKMPYKSSAPFGRTPNPPITSTHLGNVCTPVASQFGTRIPFPALPSAPKLDVSVNDAYPTQSRVPCSSIVPPTQHRVNSQFRTQLSVPVVGSACKTEPLNNDVVTRFGGSREPVAPEKVPAVITNNSSQSCINTPDSRTLFGRAPVNSGRANVSATKSQGNPPFRPALGIPHRSKIGAASSRSGIGFGISGERGVPVTVSSTFPTVCPQVVTNTPGNRSLFGRFSSGKLCTIPEADSDFQSSPGKMSSFPVDSVLSRKVDNSFADISFSHPPKALSPTKKAAANAFSDFLGTLSSSSGIDRTRAVGDFMSIYDARRLESTGTSSVVPKVAGHAIVDRNVSASFVCSDGREGQVSRGGVVGPVGSRRATHVPVSHGNSRPPEAVEYAGRLSTESVPVAGSRLEHVPKFGVHSGDSGGIVVPSVEAPHRTPVKSVGSPVRIGSHSLESGEVSHSVPGVDTGSQLYVVADAARGSFQKVCGRTHRETALPDWEMSEVHGNSSQVVGSSTDPDGMSLRQTAKRVDLSCVVKKSEVCGVKSAVSGRVESIGTSSLKETANALLKTFGPKGVAGKGLGTSIVLPSTIGSLGSQSGVDLGGGFNTYNNFNGQPLGGGTGVVARPEIIEDPHSVCDDLPTTMVDLPIEIGPVGLAVKYLKGQDGRVSCAKDDTVVVTSSPSSILSKLHAPVPSPICNLSIGAGRSSRYFVDLEKRYDFLSKYSFDTVALDILVADHPDLKECLRLAGEVREVSTSTQGLEQALSLWIAFELKVQESHRYNHKSHLKSIMVLRAKSVNELNREAQASQTIVYESGEVRWCNWQNSVRGALRKVGYNSVPMFGSRVYDAIMKGIPARQRINFVSSYCDALVQDGTASSVEEATTMLDGNVSLNDVISWSESRGIVAGATMGEELLDSHNGSRRSHPGGRRGFNPHSGNPHQPPFSAGPAPVGSAGGVFMPGQNSHVVPPVGNAVPPVVQPVVPPQAPAPGGGQGGLSKLQDVGTDQFGQFAANGKGDVGNVGAYNGSSQPFRGKHGGGQDGSSASWKGASGENGRGIGGKGSKYRCCGMSDHGRDIHIATDGLRGAVYYVNGRVPDSSNCGCCGRFHPPCLIGSVNVCPKNLQALAPGVSRLSSGQICLATSGPYHLSRVFSLVVLTLADVKSTKKGGKPPRQSHSDPIALIRDLIDKVVNAIGGEFKGDVEKLLVEVKKKMDNPSTRGQFTMTSTNLKSLQSHDCGDDVFMPNIGDDGSAFDEMDDYQNDFTGDWEDAECYERFQSDSFGSCNCVVDSSPFHILSEGVGFEGADELCSVGSVVTIREDSASYRQLTVCEPLSDDFLLNSIAHIASLFVRDILQNGCLYLVRDPVWVETDFNISDSLSVVVGDISFKLTDICISEAVEIIHFDDRVTTVLDARLEATSVTSAILDLDHYRTPFVPRDSRDHESPLVLTRRLTISPPNIHLGSECYFEALPIEYLSRFHLDKSDVSTIVCNPLSLDQESSSGTTPQVALHTAYFDRDTGGVDGAVNDGPPLLAPSSPIPDTNAVAALQQLAFYRDCSSTSNSEEVPYLADQDPGQFHSEFPAKGCDYRDPLYSTSEISVAASQQLVSHSSCFSSESVQCLACILWWDASDVLCRYSSVGAVFTPLLWVWSRISLFVPFHFYLKDCLRLAGSYIKDFSTSNISGTVVSLQLSPGRLSVYPHIFRADLYCSENICEILTAHIFRAVWYYPESICEIPTIHVFRVDLYYSGNICEILVAHFFQAVLYCSEGICEILAAHTFRAGLYCSENICEIYTAHIFRADHCRFHSTREISAAASQQLVSHYSCTKFIKFHTRCAMTSRHSTSSTLLSGSSVLRRSTSSTHSSQFVDFVPQTYSVYRERFFTEDSDCSDSAGLSSGVTIPLRYISSYVNMSFLTSLLGIPGDNRPCNVEAAPQQLVLHDDCFSYNSLTESPRFTLDTDTRSLNNNISSVEFGSDRVIPETFTRQCTGEFSTVPTVQVGLGVSAGVELDEWPDDFQSTGITYIDDNTEFGEQQEREIQRFCYRWFRLPRLVSRIFVILFRVIVFFARICLAFVDSLDPARVDIYRSYATEYRAQDTVEPHQTGINGQSIHIDPCGNLVRIRVSATKPFAGERKRVTETIALCDTGSFVSKWLWGNSLISSSFAEYARIPVISDTEGREERVVVGSQAAAVCSSLLCWCDLDVLFDGQVVLSVSETDGAISYSDKVKYVDRVFAYIGQRPYKVEQEGYTLPRGVRCMCVPWMHAHDSVVLGYSLLVSIQYRLWWSGELILSGLTIDSKLGRRVCKSMVVERVRRHTRNNSYSPISAVDNISPKAPSCGLVPSKVDLTNPVVAAVVQQLAAQFASPPQVFDLKSVGTGAVAAQQQLVSDTQISDSSQYAQQRQTVPRKLSVQHTDSTLNIVDVSDSSNTISASKSIIDSAGSDSCGNVSVWKPKPMSLHLQQTCAPESDNQHGTLVPIPVICKDKPASNIPSSRCCGTPAVSSVFGSLKSSDGKYVPSCCTQLPVNDCNVSCFGTPLGASSCDNTTTGLGCDLFPNMSRMYSDTWSEVSSIWEGKSEVAYDTFQPDQFLQLMSGIFELDDAEDCDTDVGVDRTDVVDRTAGDQSYSVFCATETGVVNNPNVGTPDDLSSFVFGTSVADNASQFDQLGSAEDVSDCFEQDVYFAADRDYSEDSSDFKCAESAVDSESPPQVQLHRKSVEAIDRWLADDARMSQWSCYGEGIENFISKYELNALWQNALLSIFICCLFLSICVDIVGAFVCTPHICGFAALDMAKGFSQFRLDESTYKFLPWIFRPPAASPSIFIVLRLFLGLSISPHVFQAAMDASYGSLCCFVPDLESFNLLVSFCKGLMSLPLRVFMLTIGRFVSNRNSTNVNKYSLRRFVVPYVDDLTFKFTNLFELLLMLVLVLRTTVDVGLGCSLVKTSFGIDLSILGCTLHAVTGSRTVDKDKASGFRSLPLPRFFKQLTTALCLANYHAEGITNLPDRLAKVKDNYRLPDNFENGSKKITKANKGRVAVRWLDEGRSFRELINALSELIEITTINAPLAAEWVPGAKVGLVKYCVDSSAAGVSVVGLQAVWADKPDGRIKVNCFRHSHWSFSAETIRKCRRLGIYSEIYGMRIFVRNVLSSHPSSIPFALYYDAQILRESDLIGLIRNNRALSTALAIAGELQAELVGRCCYRPGCRGGANVADHTTRSSIGMIELAELDDISEIRRKIRQVFGIGLVNDVSHDADTPCVSCFGQSLEGQTLSSRTFAFSDLLSLFSYANLYCKLLDVQPINFKENKMVDILVSLPGLSDTHDSVSCDVTWSGVSAKSIVVLNLPDIVSTASPGFVVRAVACKDCRSIPEFQIRDLSGQVIVSGVKSVVILDTPDSSELSSVHVPQFSVLERYLRADFIGTEEEVDEEIRVKREKKLALKGKTKSHKELRSDIISYFMTKCCFKWARQHAELVQRCVTVVCVVYVKAWWVVGMKIPEYNRYAVRIQRKADFKCPKMRQIILPALQSRCMAHHIWESTQDELIKEWDLNECPLSTIELFLARRRKSFIARVVTDATGINATLCVPHYPCTFVGYVWEQLLQSATCTNDFSVDFIKDIVSFQLSPVEPLETMWSVPCQISDINSCDISDTLESGQRLLEDVPSVSTCVGCSDTPSQVCSSSPLGLSMVDSQWLDCPTDSSEYVAAAPQQLAVSLTGVPRVSMADTSPLFSEDVYLESQSNCDCSFEVKNTDTAKCKAKGKAKAKGKVKPASSKISKPVPKATNAKKKTAVKKVVVIPKDLEDKSEKPEAAVDNIIPASISPDSPVVMDTVDDAASETADVVDKRKVGRPRKPRIVYEEQPVVHDSEESECFTDEEVFADSNINDITGSMTAVLQGRDLNEANTHIVLSVDDVADDLWKKLCVSATTTWLTFHQLYSRWQVVLGRVIKFARHNQSPVRLASDDFVPVGLLVGRIPVNNAGSLRGTRWCVNYLSDLETLGEFLFPEQATRDHIVISLVRPRFKKTLRDVGLRQALLATQHIDYATEIAAVQERQKTAEKQSVASIATRLKKKGKRVRAKEVRCALRDLLWDIDDDGLLLYDGRLALTSTLIDEFNIDGDSFSNTSVVRAVLTTLHESHMSLHPSNTVALALMEEKGYWVADWTPHIVGVKRGCLYCAGVESTGVTARLNLGSQVFLQVGSVVFVDTVVGLPPILDKGTGQTFTAILTAADGVSKMPYAAPISKPCITESLRFLLERVLEKERYFVVRTDNGQEFGSSFTSSLRLLTRTRFGHNIVHIRGPSLDPRSQSPVEGPHSEFLQYLIRGITYGTYSYEKGRAVRVQSDTLDIDSEIKNPDTLLDTDTVEMEDTEDSNRADAYAVYPESATSTFDKTVILPAAWNTLIAPMLQKFISIPRPSLDNLTISEAHSGRKLASSAASYSESPADSLRIGLDNSISTIRKAIVHRTMSRKQRVQKKNREILRSEVHLNSLSEGDFVLKKRAPRGTKYRAKWFRGIFIVTKPGNSSCHTEKVCGTAQYYINPTAVDNYKRIYVTRSSMETYIRIVLSKICISDSDLDKRVSSRMDWLTEAGACYCPDWRSGLRPISVLNEAALSCSVGTQLRWLTFVSWNINGLRTLLDFEREILKSWYKKDLFQSLVGFADLVALQETKLSLKRVTISNLRLKQMNEELTWTHNVSAPPRAGYSGTSTGVGCRLTQDPHFVTTSVSIMTGVKGDSTVGAGTAASFEPVPETTDDSQFCKFIDSMDESTDSSDSDSVSSLFSYFAVDELSGTTHSEPGLMDKEGRITVTVCSGLIFLNIYTVNAGRFLDRMAMRRLWDTRFRDFVRMVCELNPVYSVLLVGDLNALFSREAEEIHPRFAGWVTSTPSLTTEEQQRFEESRCAWEKVGLRRLTPSQPGEVGIGLRNTPYSFYISDKDWDRRTPMGFNLDFVFWRPGTLIPPQMEPKYIVGRSQAFDHQPLIGHIPVAEKHDWPQCVWPDLS